MNKPLLPNFATDDEALHFVETADLTDFDLGGGEVMQYELQAKSANVHVRMPQPLLDAVKAVAGRANVPYQRFIRKTLERALGAGRRRP